MTLTRSRGIVFIGQSYGRAYDDAPCYQALMAQVSAAIDANPTAVQTRLGGSPTIAAGQLFQRRQLCTSGSAVLAKHAGSAGYWVENDGTTSGPLLTAAVAAIAGYAETGALIVHSHGEQDASMIASFSDAALFGTGLATIWSAIRTAMNSGSPTSIPIFVDMLGMRYVGQETGEHWIRDAMIDAIAGTNVYRAAGKYAVRLGNITHPTRDLAGYAQLGAHTGRKINNWLLNGTNLPGPSIASAVRTGNSVAVTISGTIVKPLQPDYFGLFDGSGNAIAITTYSWSGNVLTITGASQPSSMRYPVRSGRVADVTRVIRLADPSPQIYTGEPGLPLEAAKAFTL